MLEDRYLKDPEIIRVIGGKFTSTKEFRWKHLRALSDVTSDHTLKVIVEWLGKRTQITSNYDESTIAEITIPIKDWQALKKLAEGK